jgi:hypothetical protein
MRKLLLAAIGATILAVGSVATSSEAMPIGAALRPAIEVVNAVEKTHWHHRWHRWGWYPHVRYYWGPRYYWAPRYHYARPFFFRPFWGGSWHHRHLRW